MKILLLLSVFFLVACSSGEDPSDNSVQEATVDVEESSGPTQEELNEKLKDEAVQAEFVKANAGEYNEGDRLFVKGEVDVLKDDSVLLKFLMSAEEGEGYGMYDVEGFNITDTEFSEGDTVTVYGTYKGKSESGLPLISVTIIEKVEEESNGTITSVEEVDEENIDVDAPLVTIEELPYDIEIQQPNSIGTVYGIATYVNESEYPLGSFRLTVNLKDQNDKTYYSTHDTVMPGETSPSFNAFAPETMNPEDIEILEINYRVILDDGSEQAVEYDVKLDRYKTIHIEDPL